MQRIRPNRRGLFILPMLLLWSFIVAFPIAPVKAAAPALDVSDHCQASVATSCTTGGMSPAATGELIVVTVTTGGSALATDRLVSTITDSKGDTFTFAVNNTNHNSFTNYLHVWIAYAYVSATGSQTVTVNFNSANPKATVQVAIFTNSANFVPVTAIGSCISSCGTSMTTSSSVADDGNSIDIGVLASSDNSNFGAVVGSGYTRIAGAGTGYCTQGGSTAGCGEYKIPSSSGTTNFPGTGYTAIWVEAGAVFGVASSVSVTVIGACTFFQLQCWWYPLLFMMTYAGFFLLVAQFLKISPRGKAHIFLSAITMGSLVAVVLGIMNIVFPLLMLVINTVIAFRLRG